MKAVMSDANKINIFYDYKEDHHYSVKVQEDAVLFEEEYAGKSLEDILHHYQQEEESLEVSEYVIKGIYHHFMSSVAKQNLSNILLFLETFKGIKTLHHILSKYSDQSISIASYGCLVVIVLIGAIPEMRDLFGSAGYCELVMYILQVNIGIPEIAEYGSYVVATLTRLHFPNIRQFSKTSFQPTSPKPSSSPMLSRSASPLPTSRSNSPVPMPASPASNNNISNIQVNICELLSQHGIFGCNLRHPRSVYIARNICLALGNLADPLFTKSIRQYPIIPLLMQLYQLHYQNHTIFLHAFFYSYHRMLLLHPSFIRIFVTEYQALALFTDITKYYQDIPILFRMWQVYIHSYQRALVISTSLTSNTSHSHSSPSTNPTLDNSHTELNFFQSALLQSLDGVKTLFTKIYTAMSYYPLLLDSKEMVELKAVLDEIEALASAKGSSEAVSKSPQLFAFLATHTDYERYVRCLFSTKSGVTARTGKKENPIVIEEVFIDAMAVKDSVPPRNP